VIIKVSILNSLFAGTDLFQQFEKRSIKMYMRLVQAKFTPDSLPHIQKIYEDKIIPQLQKTQGCLCACLIHSEHDNNEGMSLTLWASQADAEAYDKSGLFLELLGKVKPHFSDSSEWKIQLSEDLQLEYQPVPDEPIVKSYTTTAQSDKQIPDHDETSLMYLRITYNKIQPGKMEEFRKIYIEEIIPALQTVPGCLYAFLTENIEKENEAISITIWNSKQAAIEYETGRLFEQLIDKAKHTFSGLYQWKLALEREHPAKVKTSEDLAVTTYNVVTGKNF